MLEWIPDSIKLWEADSPGATKKGHGGETQRVSRHLLNGKFTPYNFRFGYQEGYRKNALVYACIAYWRRSVGQSNIVVQDGDEDIQRGHRLGELTTKVNDHMDQFQLLDLTLTHLFLSGNAYWELVRDRTGRIVEIWPFLPHRMKIIADKSEVIAGYAHNVDGEDHFFPPEDVVHFRLQDPGDLRTGMPILQAAFPSIQIDNESTKFVKALLENSGIPGVVVGTNKRPKKDRRKKLEKRWQRKFSGRDRGKPAFMKDVDDVKVVGMDLEQLAWPNLRQISESEITGAFGMQPILVSSLLGLQEGSFSTGDYDGARRAFWQDSVIPMESRISATLSRQLLPQIEGGDSSGKMELEVAFDNSGVPAIEQIRKEERKRTLEEWKSGAITLDEYRRKTGRDEIGGELGESFRKTGKVSFVNEEGESISGSPSASPDEQDDEGNGGSEPSEDDEDKGEENGEETEPMKGFSKEKGDGGGKENGHEGTERQLSKEKILTERDRLAKRYEDDFREYAEQEFKRQAKDVEVIFNKSTKQLTPDQKDEFVNQMNRIRTQWEQRIAKEGGEDSIFPLIEQVTIDSGEVVASEIGMDPFSDVDTKNMERFARNYSFKFAQKISETSVRDMREVIEDAMSGGKSVQQTRNELLERFNNWTKDRAEMVGRTESIRASNRGTQFAYSKGGVKAKEWLAASDPCPYCQRLDGKKEAVEADFASVGEELKPAEGREENKPMKVSYEDIPTPPAHPNCRCTIISAEV